MAAGAAFHLRHNTWNDGCVLYWLGGVVNAGLAPFRAGGVFPPEWLARDINSNEIYALYHVLRQFCARHPDALRRAQVLMDIDNQSVVGAFKRGRAKDPATHALLIQLFDLQVPAGSVRLLADIEVDPDGVQRDRGRYLTAIARVDHSPAPRHLPGRVERATSVHHRPYGIHRIRSTHPSECPYAAVLLAIRLRGVLGRRRASARHFARAKYRRTSFGLCFPPPGYGRTHCTAPGRV